MRESFQIKEAAVDDIPLILSFIKELADYVKLLHEVVATEEILAESLFGNESHAKVVIAYLGDKAVGFALYFHNFSTFLGRPGIYLEDLYVKPEVRGKGVGKKLLGYLARRAKELNCGLLKWSVLDRNTGAVEFYRRIGATAMDEWTTQRLAGDALDRLAALSGD